MNILEQTAHAIAMIQMHTVLDLMEQPWSPNSMALAEELDARGLLRSDPPDEGEVMAFRTTGNNSHLIEDCFKLGYLTDEMKILDPTYGMGVFWKRHRPPLLIGTDIDPEKSPGGTWYPSIGAPTVYEGGRSIDFTKMFWPDASFDAVVFDPDYKMQGTDSGQGPAKSNIRYGMARDYRAVAEQLGIIGQGLSECVRVAKPGGVIAVKHMDQVVSGDTVFQTDLVLVTMDELKCAKFAEFHLEGHRKQPTHDKCKACGGRGTRVYSSTSLGRGVGGQTMTEAACDRCGGEGKVPRRQVHERHNFSTLALYRKAKS